MTGPTSHPFRKAFACGAIALVVLLVVMVTIWGAPGDMAGFMFGYLLGLTALAAVITGFLARRARRAWSTTRIAVIYIGVLFAVALVLIIGKLPPRPQ